MANDVVQTLRRQRAEQAEREAVDAALSLRQMELVAEGEFGYRIEVTTNIDTARTAAETTRDRADVIKEHAGITEPLQGTFRDEIKGRLKNMQFQLKQQDELAEHADVYGLNPEDQEFSLEQIKASIQALTEWLDANPAPNRAARRARNTADAVAGDDQA